MEKVRSIAVVGAGVMGRGIAYAAALGGFQTKLHDVSPAALRQAEETIRENLRRGAELGKVTPQAMASALANLQTTEDFQTCVRDADFVIEAVTEDLKVKIPVFKTLDETCPPHTILATNTSAMSPTELGAATSRPAKVVGMHFFNPAHIMKLVEIVRGLETSDETVETAREVARAMGKETVVVNEFPGFATTRISALIGNEAFYMLMEGVATAEDIDRAVKLGLNHPMGPLELADLVGLDTRLHVLEYLHRTLGEKYRPCPLLSKYVAAGRLGRKTGRGVYEYPKQP